MLNFAGIGLRATEIERFQTRAIYSRSTLKAFATKLNKAKHPESFSALTIYSAGSYGRLEASKHSDIDLFFVLSKPRASFEEIRVPEIRLLSEIVDIGYTMSFPKFSNDGNFLKFLFLNDILDMACTRFG
jgi:UTP:GlnB (protein PII) uridylyltransferase